MVLHHYPILPSKIVLLHHVLRDMVPFRAATSQRPRLLWHFPPQLWLVYSVIYYIYCVRLCKELSHSLYFSDLRVTLLHPGPRLQYPSIGLICAISSVTRELKIS